MRKSTSSRAASLAKGTNPNHLMALKLFNGDNQQQLVDCGVDLSAGYHTYSMEYRQASSIRFFLDGSNVYTYTRNVPSGPYYIILSNGVASARTADWHTQVSSSTSASQPDAGLLRARPGTVEPRPRVVYPLFKVSA